MPRRSSARFYNLLREDKSEKAWDLTADTFGESRSDFAARMRKTKGLVGSRGEWNRQPDAGGGFTYKGRIITRSSSMQFELEVVRKSDGYRIRSFSVLD